MRAELAFRKDLSNYKNRDSKIKSKDEEVKQKTQEEKDLDYYIFKQTKAANEEKRERSQAGFLAR